MIYSTERAQSGEARLLCTHTLPKVFCDIAFQVKTQLGIEFARIPWLLLQTVTTDGDGPFSSVTYIQRVNTKGGLVPTAPGSAIGAVAEVPYSAEYYFFRARN